MYLAFHSLSGFVTTKWSQLLFHFLSSFESFSKLFPPLVLKTNRHSTAQNNSKLKGKENRSCKTKQNRERDREGEKKKYMLIVFCVCFSWCLLTLSAFLSKFVSTSCRRRRCRCLLLLLSASSYSDFLSLQRLTANTKFIALVCSP